ncbi:MAG TPA: hypothetical protein VK747_10350, partial [Blastocatellia bacterium]|nr:hypothetical protein [Blastocatellia bacterium]
MPRQKTAPAKQTKKKATTMSARVKSTPSVRANAKPTKKGAQPSLEDQVKAVLTSLKRLAEKRVLEDMSKRYG